MGWLAAQQPIRQRVRCHSRVIAGASQVFRYLGDLRLALLLTIVVLGAYSQSAAAVF